MNGRQLAVLVLTSMIAFAQAATFFILVGMREDIRDVRNDLSRHVEIHNGLNSLGRK
jgi:hypothetical protein